MILSNVKLIYNCCKKKKKRQPAGAGSFKNMALATQ